MAKTIDRYIFTQLLLPFAVALLTFVVLISGHFLWQATEIIVQHRVDAWSILRLVGLQLPRASVLAVPVATLLACSLVMNRMVSEKEIVAISAGGISTARMIRPLVAMALVACAFCLADSELLVPAADRGSRQLISQVLISRKTLSFKPAIFVDGGNGIHYYAGEVDTRNDVLGHLIAFVVPSRGPVMSLFAPRAVFDDHGIEIASAQWYTLDENGSFTSVRDSGVHIDLASIPEGSFWGGAAMTNFSLGELWRRARDLNHQYADQGAQYLMELYWRLALSISPLIFALLAVPVTLRLGRSESLIGVLATIIVVFIYFVLMLWMRMLGDAGRLPPFVAAWLPNFVIAFLAVVGIYRHR